MKRLSGAARVLVLITSVGILAALIASVASALGYLPAMTPESGVRAAEVSAVGSGILFVVLGTRTGRGLGVFTVVVVVLFAVIELVYARAGDPWLLDNGLIVFPLMAVLQILAPLAAVVCGFWGLYAVATGARTKVD